MFSLSATNDLVLVMVVDGISVNTWTVCWRNINQQLADLTTAAAAAAAAEGETKQDDAERESRRRGVFRSVSHLSSLLSSFEAILMSILISM